ncbi:hypothetical protein [Halobacterium sp. R2-5]|uniref:hypothetical protein n=1 Tax=Halobacterium sp. R2-5 TaxID=2715751 RepID=UPI00142275A8|nr:hypothetical protein [Halobacterium sp. R2-5]NIB98614.1 hypothetical protein [Halobacterium sp. R2-5]
MVRNRRAPSVALLCVLAVSLAAATLADPQEPTGGSGTDSQSGDGGDGLGNPEPVDGDGPFRTSPPCVPLLATPTAAFGILGFAGLLGLVAYRRDGVVPALVVVFVTRSSDFHTPSSPHRV